MSDLLKMPPERDYGFYQRRKHDKWRAVEAPMLEGPVADSHAHIHMLPEPAWELERCAANGVDFVCEICDPSEDGSRPFDKIDSWAATAPVVVRMATGVHPHNAKLYNETIEQELMQRLDDPRVLALGEIGLDYHYDLSPRETQRKVFKRQIELAKQADLPIVLHLRGGEDPVADNAHRESFEILQDMDALGPATLLHCCALPPDDLAPWVESGCFVAFGGALTFKSADAAREGARIVPEDRLMVETDSPYMTPEPMRGSACTPAHVVFVAAALAEVRGAAAGEARRAFLQQLHANTLSFYRDAVE